MLIRSALQTRQTAGLRVSQGWRDGLITAFNGVEIGRVDGGFPATLVGSIGHGVTPVGIGYQGDGSSKYAYRDTDAVSANALTVLAVVYDGATGPADRRAFGVADRANASNYLAIGRGSTNAAKARVLAVVGGSAGTSTVETSANVFDGNAHAVVLRWTQGVGTQSFVDGRIDSFAANTTASAISASRTTVCALGRSTFATFYGGVVLLGASWARGLVDQDCIALTANPWQLFAPRSIWVPVSVGAGGASSITAAAGASTASTLAASSTAAFTPTAAAGTGTASTVAASSTAASAITSATGTATASTLTGSAVVAGAITAAAGVATGGTLVGDTLAAGSAAIVAADGVATTATLGGSSVAAAAIGVAAGAATASVMGGPGAAAQITGGGWFPMPRRRTKKELDDERRRLGILPPEVVEEVAAAPVARRRITLQDLIGKKAAAEITNVDLSQAIAASKKRKRQRDDELLLLM